MDEGDNFNSSKVKGETDSSECKRRRKSDEPKEMESETKRKSVDENVTEVAATIERNNNEKENSGCAEIHANQSGTANCVSEIVDPDKSANPVDEDICMTALANSSESNMEQSTETIKTEIAHITETEREMRRRRRSARNYRNRSITSESSSDTEQEETVVKTNINAQKTEQTDTLQSNACNKPDVEINIDTASGSNVAVSNTEQQIDSHNSAETALATSSHHTHYLRSSTKKRDALPSQSALDATAAENTLNAQTVSEDRHDEHLGDDSISDEMNADTPDAGRSAPLILSRRILSARNQDREPLLHYPGRGVEAAFAPLSRLRPRDRFLDRIGDRDVSSDSEFLPGPDDDDFNLLFAPSSDSSSDLDLSPYRHPFDDEDNDLVRNPHGEASNQEDVNALNEVMNKPKPSYTWNFANELMKREHGIIGNAFNTHFYSSRQVVERMNLSDCLRKHRGCVNCLNFNRSGELLCSGSDDLRIVVWDWAHNKVNHFFKSGHTENIFQTKFLKTDFALDIVSAGRDGQLRRSTLPSSGGKIQSSCLYKHSKAVHKIVIVPQNVNEIMSVGEDAYIRLKDLRCDGDATDMSKVVTTKGKKKVHLFSISHHPFANEICVCGSDNFVRVYDKRNFDSYVREMCPEQLKETSPQITCCVYNAMGTEVLASYSDDHIYLFDNINYKPGEYLHRYKGHYNHRTIKGVNFFGPNSEYVISGSDCGNIFFWDKNTEAILNYLPGDTGGVVNCLEPHPSIPVLATSGLDHNIKIWTPNSQNYPPDLSELEKCVKRNLRRSIVEHVDLPDGRQFSRIIRQFVRRNRERRRNVTGDSSSSDSSENERELWSSSNTTGSDDEASPRLESIQCHTQ